MFYGDVQNYDNVIVYYEFELLEKRPFKVKSFILSLSVPRYEYDAPPLLTLMNLSFVTGLSKDLLLVVIKVALYTKGSTIYEPMWRIKYSVKLLISIDFHSSVV